jgi:hypothetical protein
MNYLKEIDDLNPELIESFLSTGKAEGIPKEIQYFLKQIQWAAEVYEYERNITRASKNLHVRILAEQHQNVNIRTCKSRIYAAINYFNIDNNVSIKIWESNFADKYEDLAKMCASQGDYKTQLLCYKEAQESRRRASEAAETDKDWAPVFLISDNIPMEKLGFKKKSLKEIAHKSNEGFYIHLIDSLPIDKGEKTRLLRDSDIEEAQVIENENEE